MATKKKVVQVDGERNASTPEDAVERPGFSPTKEAKGRATQLRLIAGILWVLGIGAQVWAITLLFKQPITMWLIVIGGMIYSMGVIFHVWERLRFQNAIWHGFVVAAAAVHYSAVVTSVVSSI